MLPWEAGLLAWRKRRYRGPEQQVYRIGVPLGHAYAIFPPIEGYAAIVGVPRTFILKTGHLPETGHLATSRRLCGLLSAARACVLTVMVASQRVVDDLDGRQGTRRALDFGAHPI
jgi:hypothetical protein